MQNTYYMYYWIHKVNFIWVHPKIAIVVQTFDNLFRNLILFFHSYRTGFVSNPFTLQTIRLWVALPSSHIQFAPNKPAFNNNTYLTYEIELQTDVALVWEWCICIHHSHIVIEYYKHICVVSLYGINYLCICCILFIRYILFSTNLNLACYRYAAF